MYRCILTGIAALFPFSALACDIALVLAVDVSGSVSEQEYRIQMDGLAAALRNGAVADALVDGQANVTLVQWTGTSRQRQTIPWTTMTTLNDVLDIAELVEDDLRRWRNYSTAIGEAVALSAALFDEVPQCERRVIDVSGDGISNEGESPDTHHPVLREKNITLNALAIETDDEDLTGYFYENLIYGQGAFVMTANSFDDYPRQIKRKLVRETTKQLSFFDAP